MKVEMPRALATNEQAANVQLVLEIEKYPCLYNSNLSDYAKRDIVDANWNKVAVAVNDTAANCKEKWRNLRTVFVRRQKIVARSFAKSRKMPKPYYLNDCMQFVVPFLKKKTDSPTEGISSPELKNDDSGSIYSEKCNDFNDNFTDTFAQSNMMHVPRFMQQLQQHNVENNDADDDLNARKYFILSMLPEIQAFSPTQFRLFRRKILDAIDDVNDYGKSPPSNSMHPVRQTATSTSNLDLGYNASIMHGSYDSFKTEADTMPYKE